MTKEGFIRQLIEVNDFKTKLFTKTDDFNGEMTKSDWEEVEEALKDDIHLNFKMLATIEKIKVNSKERENIISELVEEAKSVLNKTELPVVASFPLTR